MDFSRFAHLNVNSQPAFLPSVKEERAGVNPAFGAPKQNAKRQKTGKKHLFCNDKRVPDWASDMQKVGQLAVE